MEEVEKMNRALKAIDKILENLQDSDFVSQHGTAPLAELRKFRVDMAADIVEACFE